jgi:hypothetical protein
MSLKVDNCLNIIGHDEEFCKKFDFDFYETVAFPELDAQKIIEHVTLWCQLNQTNLEPILTEYPYYLEYKSKNKGKTPFGITKEIKFDDNEWLKLFDGFRALICKRIISLWFSKLTPEERKKKMSWGLDTQTTQTATSPSTNSGIEVVE